MAPMLFQWMRFPIAHTSPLQEEGAGSCSQKALLPAAAGGSPAIAIAIPGLGYVHLDGSPVQIGLVECRNGLVGGLVIGKGHELSLIHI